MSEFKGMLVNILLCDNDQYILEIYKNLLLHIGEKHHFTINMELYSNDSELLFMMEDEEVYKWDLLILNSKFKKNSGIDVAKSMKKNGCNAEVLFLSSDKSKARESFEVSPFYYLIEGETTHKEFEDIILKSLGIIKEKNSNAIILKSEGGGRKADLNKIVFFKITHRIVSVYEIGGYVGHFYDSLQNIEVQLKEKGFIRVHRSYIVNIRYIDIITKIEISMVTGALIPIGNTYRKELIDSVMQNGDVVIL